MDKKLRAVTQITDTKFPTIGIRFGFMCKPILEQIKEQLPMFRFTRHVRSEMRYIQLDAAAVSRLYLSSTLTDLEVRRARKRLMTRITKLLDNPKEA